MNLSVNSENRMDENIRESGRCCGRDVRLRKP